MLDARTQARPCRLSSLPSAYRAEVDEPPTSQASIDRGAERRNKLAYASACFGFASIVVCFLFVANVLAIVLGIAALVQCHRDPTYTNRRDAIAGVVLGVVTLAIWLVVWWMLETERIVMIRD